MAEDSKGDNMAKPNGATWKVIATLGGFIVVIVGAAVAWGMLAKDVERTHEEVDNVRTDIETIKPKVETNTQKTLVVERDIWYIQQDIEDIQRDNETIKDGIEELLKK